MSRVRPEFFGRGMKASARLAFANKPARFTEQHERPACLVQARAMAGVSHDDDRAAALSITDHISRVSQDHQEALFQAGAGSVGRRASTDHRQSRSVEPDRELGTDCSLDFDHGGPASDESSHEQSMPVRTRESDLAVTLIETGDQFGVNALIVANFGNQDHRDVGREALGRFRPNFSGHYQAWDESPRK